MVGRAGIEPATLWLKARCSTPELAAHRIKTSYSNEGPRVSGVARNLVDAHDVVGPGRDRTSVQDLLRTVHRKDHVDGGSITVEVGSAPQTASQTFALVSQEVEVVPPVEDLSRLQAPAAGDV
jgi:hypothetical protein